MNTCKLSAIVTVITEKVHKRKNTKVVATTGSQAIWQTCTKGQLYSFLSRQILLYLPIKETLEESVVNKKKQRINNKLERTHSKR